MGAFYGSIHIRSTDLDAVDRVLESMTRSTQFLRTPVIDGWITVFPSDHGQDERVSKKLAGKLADQIVHVSVHDDDVFCYWYYRQGKVVDRFNSCPDYFEAVSDQQRRKLRGRPELLAHLVTPGHSGDLDAILDASRDQPLFASRQLEQFASALGLPYVLNSYEYLMAGETDEIAEWPDFVHHPDLREQELAEQKAEAARELELLKLEEARILRARLPFESRRGKTPRRTIWCGTESQLILSDVPLAARGDSTVRQLSAPWRQAVELDLHLKPQAVCLATDDEMRWLAVGYAGPDWGAELWDLREQSLVHSITHTSTVSSVLFRGTPLALYSLSHHELVVTDVANGRRVAEHSVEEARALDVNAAGKLAGVKSDHHATLIDLESGLSRRIRRGTHQDRSGLRALVEQQMADEMKRAGPDFLIKSTEQAMEQLQIPADSPVGRRMLEEAREQSAKLQSGEAFESLSQNAFQPDNFFCVKLAAGGTYLACATSSGLHLYDTAELGIADAEADLAPRWTVNPPSVPFEYSPIAGYYYAVAEDAVRGALYFGGTDGCLSQIDLATGQHRKVLAIPGKPAILELSVAGQKLYSLCHPGFPERQTDPVLHIWELDALHRIENTHS